VPQPEYDELAIEPYTRRWGFVKLSNWAMTDAVGTVKLNFAVTPYLTQQTTTNVYLPTPVSLAAMGFHAWRGSLEYRIIIPATPYHRGKLYFFHSPNTVSNGSVTLSTMNTRGCLVDLSQTVDMVFRVGWAQQFPWCADDLTPQFEAHGTIVSTLDVNQSNGSFMCQVIEPLLAPAAGSSVDIVVLVRAGDDFELAEPTATGFQFYQATSATTTTEMVDVVGPSPMVCDLSSLTVDDALASVVFGERVKSLRTVMKSYQPTLALYASRESGGEIAKQATGHTVYLPLYPLMVQSSFATSTYPSGAAPAQMWTHMSWWSTPFLGVKGSVKHRVLPLVFDSASNTTSLGSGLSKNLLCWLSNFAGQTPYTDPLVPVEYSAVGSTWTPANWMSGMFSFGDGSEVVRVGPGGATTVDGTFQQGNGQFFTYIPNSSAHMGPSGPTLTVLSDDSCYNDSLIVTDFVAAGEDFTPVWWMGTRLMTSFDYANTWLPAVYT
jgi:hypothetical protein